MIRFVSFFFFPLFQSKRFKLSIGASADRTMTQSIVTIFLLKEEKNKEIGCTTRDMTNPICNRPYYGEKPEKGEGEMMLEWL